MDTNIFLNLNSIFTLLPFFLRTMLMPHLYILFLYLHLRLLCLWFSALPLRLYLALVTFLFLTEGQISVLGVTVLDLSSFIWDLLVTLRIHQLQVSLCVLTAYLPTLLLFCLCHQELN